MFFCVFFWGVGVFLFLLMLLGFFGGLFGVFFCIMSFDHRYEHMLVTTVISGTHLLTSRGHVTSLL